MLSLTGASASRPTSSCSLAAGIINVVGSAQALHRERCLQSEPISLGSISIVRPIQSYLSAPKSFADFRPRCRRYADHVGIHYVLCSKLRQFSYEEIEFFLPQLCHLIISLDNESMALEEFILDLCEESVNGALLVKFLKLLHPTHFLILHLDILAFSNLPPRPLK
jgi:hypothetical protein